MLFGISFFDGAEFTVFHDFDSGMYDRGDCGYGHLCYGDREEVSEIVFKPKMYVLHDAG